jgi:cbb3-type cytochrome oxidase cytochrome c subunit
MIRISKLALFGLVIGAIAGSTSTARAQGMTVDDNLAKRGKSLWLGRSCDGCHSIGKGRRAGPDLLGVTERRDAAWLKRWLKNPEAMLASDSVAQGLLAESKGVKMPNLKLSDQDIDALMNYVASESQKLKK